MHINKNKKSVFISANQKKKLSLIGEILNISLNLNLNSHKMLNEEFNNILNKIDTHFKGNLAD